MRSATPTRSRLRNRRSAESAGSAPIDSARSTSSRGRHDVTTLEGRRSPSARRSPLELLLDSGGVEAARGQENVRVEPEVGELGDEPLVALGNACEGGLD